MKGFKKVFGKKDKKKKKPAVSEKNRVFSKQSSSTSFTSTDSDAKPPKRMIGKLKKKIVLF